MVLQVDASARERSLGVVGGMEQLSCRYVNINALQPICFPKPHVRATVVGVASALWRCSSSSRFISRPQTSEQRPAATKKVSEAGGRGEGNLP